MSTAMPVSIYSMGPMEPIAQFKQFGTACASILSSICKRADTAFCRAEINKLDEKKQVRVFKHANPETGDVKEVSVLSYIADLKTGNFYLDEPRYVVAVKCALIFAIGNPLYTGGVIAWHMIKTPIEIGLIALIALKNAGELFLQGRISSSIRALMQGLKPIFPKCAIGIYEIIRAPLFALGVQIAALYGIFKPYHGRKIEALIENAWQNGVSYKADFRNAPEREREGCLQAFLTDIQLKRPFYLAYCFQVRGNLKDVDICVLKQTPV